MRALLWMLAACDAEPPPPTITPPPPVTAPAPAPAPAPEPDAPLPARITARHIVIGFAGSAASEATRSREEAAQLAEQLRQRLEADPSLFSSLAVEFSDGPTSVMGGHLGTFEQGVMDPAFEAAAFRLPVGGISSVFETPFGFHVVERLPSEAIRVAHVLVQWQGVARATEATRSQDEARAIAEEALRRVQAGEPIDAVARALSDGPNAARGGDLGAFTRGQLVPAFEDAAFALAVGEASGIVESPMGYHIIVRLE